MSWYGPFRTFHLKSCSKGPKHNRPKRTESREVSKPLPLQMLPPTPGLGNLTNQKWMVPMWSYCDFGEDTNCMIHEVLAWFYRTVYIYAHVFIYIYTSIHVCTSIYIHAWSQTFLLVWHTILRRSSETISSSSGKMQRITWTWRTHLENHHLARGTQWGILTRHIIQQLF